MRKRVSETCLYFLFLKAFERECNVQAFFALNKSNRTEKEGSSSTMLETNNTMVTHKKPKHRR